MTHSAIHLNLLFCLSSGCQHEKYTSQLQVGVNPLELGKTEQVDEKTSAVDMPHSKHEKNERKSNIGNLSCLICVLRLPLIRLSGGSQQVLLLHYHGLQYVHDICVKLYTVQLFVYLKKNSTRID